MQAEIDEKDEFRRQYAWEMENKRKEEEAKRLERKRLLQEKAESRRETARILKLQKDEEARAVSVVSLISTKYLSMPASHLALLPHPLSAIQSHDVSCPTTTTPLIRTSWRCSCVERRPEDESSTWRRRARRSSSPRGCGHVSGMQT